MCLENAVRVIFVQKRYDQLGGVKKKFEGVQKGPSLKEKDCCVKPTPAVTITPAGTRGALVLLCSGGKSTLEFVQT